MITPVPVTPEQICAAIHDLMDENDRLNKELMMTRVGRDVFDKRNRANRPKLNKREVTAIRAMSRSGETNRSIADIYQINPATVSRIIRGIYHR